jgi:fibronectin type 3 domain-containing protein
VRPTTRAVAVLLLAVGTLAACGKKGPPVAPELRVPVVPSALHGSVDGESIVVSWTRPERRLDGSRLRSVDRYTLYRREEADSGPPKSAMLSNGRVVGYDEIATIRTESPAPATIQGSSVTWVDRRALSLGRRYVYVVTAEDATGRISAPSERLVVPFVAAPKAPAALDARPEDGRVTLTWQPPPALVDGSPVTGDIRYVILRGSGATGPLAAITPQPLADTTYTDTGLDNDADYRYAVRAVRVEPSVTAAGEASAAVTVAPLDTTPPSAPTGLVAVPSADAVRLAWNASPEPDVATYAIYRATGNGDFMRIATTTAPGTIHTDGDVKAGTTYRYAVTALDRARRTNESARSNVVSVRVN